MKTTNATPPASSYSWPSSPRQSRPRSQLLQLGAAGRGSGTVGKGSPEGVDFIFTITGERAVSGISKAKERLDKRMLELLRAALTTPARMPGRSRWGSGRCLIHGARQRPE